VQKASFRREHLNSLLKGIEKQKERTVVDLSRVLVAYSQCHSLNVYGPPKFMY
jgi:hypothetical protein